MFTGVNSKGSGESGTVHSRIRIPYVSIKSCCVQLLKLLDRLAHEILVLIVHVPMSLITYPKWMVTCGGGVVMVISHFENIIST